MNISLREVDQNNFWQCIGLKVADSQTGYVATNVGSIAESKVYPHLVPQAIYDGEIIVGFALYGRDPETENYWIVRFMIDEKYQSKGYGKAALAALVEKMKRLPECSEIFLSYVPQNSAAERFYLRAGFEKTGGTIGDGELIVRLDLRKSADNRAMTADN